MTKSFAQSKAREILTELSITTPPILIEDVIESFGLKLEQINGIDKFEGQLIPEKRLIRINQNKPKNRQRFTIAHELGHWVLYHQGRIFETDEEPALLSLNGFSPSLESSYSHKQREAEANYFAGELLIPIKWLEIDWKKYNPDIKKLSDLYQVSEEALWKKILELDKF